MFFQTVRGASVLAVFTGMLICSPMKGGGNLRANPPEKKPTCNDGIKNGCETDIDCGGEAEADETATWDDDTCPVVCAACRAGQACKGDADCYKTCINGVCQPTNPTELRPKFPDEPAKRPRMPDYPYSAE